MPYLICPLIVVADCYLNFDCNNYSSANIKTNCKAHIVLFLLTNQKKSPIPKN